jgi:ubiquitin carboxyl-terminal hydrolase 36/42
MCSSCKKKCEARKRFSIEKSPRVLIVHFKRFTNSGGKIGDFIKYPSTFCIDNFMSASIDRAADGKGNAPSGAKEIFDLYGVVVHQGGGCRSGHYYSFVKDEEGEWWDCNDEYVQRARGGI